MEQGEQVHPDGMGNRRRNGLQSGGVWRNQGLHLDPEEFYYLEAQESRQSQEGKPTKCGQIRGNEEDVKELVRGKYDQKESMHPVGLMTSEKLSQRTDASFGFHHVEGIGDHCGTGFVEDG